MVSTTNAAAKGASELEKQEAMRKRAARQAAKSELAAAEQPTVECVVLPAGHDRISMGDHVAGLGEVHFEEKETFTTTLSNALALYRKGWVNFDGAREAQEAENGRIRAQAQAELADKLALEKAMGMAGL